MCRPRRPQVQEACSPLPISSCRRSQARGLPELAVAAAGLGLRSPGMSQAAVKDIRQAWLGTHTGRGPRADEQRPRPCRARQPVCAATVGLPEMPRDPTSEAPRPRPVPPGLQGLPHQQAPSRSPCGDQAPVTTPAARAHGRVRGRAPRRPTARPAWGFCTCPAPTPRASLGPEHAATVVSRGPNDRLQAAETRLERQSPVLCTSQRDTWHWAQGSLGTADSPGARRARARRGQRAPGPTRRTAEGQAASSRGSRMLTGR